MSPALPCASWCLLTALLVTPTAFAQTDEIAPPFYRAYGVLGLPPAGGSGEDLVVTATLNHLAWSNDGGVTHSVQNSPPGNLFHSVVADGAGAVYAASQGQLWRNAGQGGPWTSIGASISANRGPFAVATSARGPGGVVWAWFEGASGGLFRTTDGGASWNVISGIPAATGSSSLISAHLTNPDRAVVTPFGANDTFGITLDGGRTWAAVASPDPGPILEVTYSADSLLLRSTAGLNRSIDGGATWTRTVDIATPHFSKAALQADPWRPGRVLFATSELDVLESMDGGASWTPIAALPGGLTFGALSTSPSDPDDFYLATQSLGVLRSLPAVPGSAPRRVGVRGRPSAPLGNYAPTAVLNLTVDDILPHHLLAEVEIGSSGPPGIFAESFDGGSTWAVLTSPAGSLFGQLPAHYALDGGRLWFVGRSTVFPGPETPIFVRADGVWSQVGTVTGDALSIVVSPDVDGLVVVKRGRLSGTGTELVASHDGGVSFGPPFALNTVDTIEDVQFLPGTNGPRLLWVAQRGFQSFTVGFTDNYLTSSASNVLSGQGVPRVSLIHARSRPRDLRLSIDAVRFLHTSPDAGSTFQPMGNLPSRARWVTFLSQDPETLYRMGFIQEPDRRSIDVSRDGGRTWTRQPQLPTIIDGSENGGIAVSADDTDLYFWGRFGLRRFALDESIGATLCSPAVPNSTGAAARISLIGSASVQVQDHRLFVNQLPQNVPVLFLAGRQFAVTPNPGGSEGNLCLAGPIGRYSQSIRFAGPLGECDFAIDPSSLPQPNGFEAAQAGDQWVFQAWHRDTVQGVATSNFTPAVALTWEP